MQLFNARLKVSNGQEKENLQSLTYDVSDKGTGVVVNKGNWVGRSSSNLKVRKGEGTDGTAPAADKQ